jgi:hypothetical protein
MTDPQIFSARLDAPLGSPGPPTSASVSGVRDVILCAKGEEDTDGDEFRDHPPVGSRDWVGYVDPEKEDKRVGSIELGRDVQIERLDSETAELVMNACTPRGHYFFAIRQFGQVYSFVRHLPPTEHEENPYRWDPDGLLQHALMFSRLIRDNGYSTQYAVRITDYEDGEQQVVYLPSSQDAIIFRLRRDREYLDGPEAEELAALLGAYWEAADALPARVEEAIWRVAITPRFQNGKAVNSYLCGGLEALLKTRQGPVTNQFKRRVRSLATELGLDGIDKEFLRRIYKERSDWVHGSIPLYTPTALDVPASAEASVVDPEIDLADIALLQDLLRKAVRRCVEDADFRAAFATDKAIKARWT